MTTETTRCDNLACLCEVSLTAGSCSDYCRSEPGQDPNDIVCKCAHEKCAKANEAQLHGGSGSES